MTPSVQCCIAGGGPAGMMLGYLLARKGVETLVLEKHGDFLRDFRGDTIHPSTLELMYELGLLETFLKLPHEKVEQLTGQIGGVDITIADFSHLPTHCRYIAFMPQWDFLNFLVEEAKRYPAFQLNMQTEVTGLLHKEGRVVGVEVKTPEGPASIYADLVVGADGRHSVVREKAGLTVEDSGAPMDVLWMRLSRRAEDKLQPLGRFDRGKIMIMLNRGDYWQCGYVITKGAFEEIQRRGLDSFRQDVVQLAPFVRDRVSELSSWNHIKLLTVRVDHLREWYSAGLLCIGDAAHAMSPMGGVGINLAVQDAVAAANILSEPLRLGRLQVKDLAAVQKRRELPARLIQRMQVFFQNRVIRRALGLSKNPPLALPLRLLRAWPFMRRLPARLIGIGFRPEHIAALIAGVLFCGATQSQADSIEPLQDPKAMCESFVKKDLRNPVFDPASDLRTLAYNRFARGETGPNPAWAAALPCLRRALEDSSSRTRSDLIDTIGLLEIPELDGNVRSDNWLVRCHEVLRTGNRSVIPLVSLDDVTSLLKDSNAFVRQAALKAVRDIKTYRHEIPSPSQINDIVTLLSGSDADIRNDALGTLGFLGPDAKTAVEPLVNLAEQDKDITREEMSIADVRTPRWPSAALIRRILMAIGTPKAQVEANRIAIKMREGRSQANLAAIPGEMAGVASPELWTFAGIGVLVVAGIAWFFI